MKQILPPALPTLAILSFQTDLGDLVKGFFLSPGTPFLKAEATFCWRTKNKGEEHIHTHTHTHKYMHTFFSSLPSDSFSNFFFFLMFINF